MAAVFRHHGHLAETAERCRRALDLEPLNWRASRLLAKVVFSAEEAIDILVPVIDRLEVDTTWAEQHQPELAEMNAQLAERYEESKQTEKALQAYSKSIRQNPDDYNMISATFNLFAEQCRWDDILKLVDTIQSIEDGTQLATITLACVEEDDYHKVLMDTRVKTGRRNLLDDAYKKAIEYAIQKKQHDALCLLRMHYASALLRLPQRREQKIIYQFETALNEDLPNTRHDVESMLECLIPRLGGLYMGHLSAAKAKEDTELVNEVLNNICHLVSEQVPDWQLLFPPQLFAARYFHLQGDDAQARQVLRHLFKISIALLSDGDDGNDAPAYIRLFYACLVFDDDENAITAAHMAAWNTMYYSISTWTIPCEPHREEEWDTNNEVWVCRDCIGLGLDKESRQNLGRLDYNMCDPEHQFLHIPAMNEELVTSTPPGHVLHRTAYIPLEEWREEIRKKYLE